MMLVVLVVLAASFTIVTLIVLISGRRRNIALQSRRAYLQGFISLPKVEVHAHLGGSARCSSVEEWLRERRGLSHKHAAERANMFCIPRVLGAPLEPTLYQGELES
jgi:hypothetical protein